MKMGSLQSPDKVKSRGEQLLSSAGHVVPPLFVSRGPYFGQKYKVKAKKIGLRGPGVSREPGVAPPGLETFLSLNFAKL